MKGKDKLESKEIFISYSHEDESFRDELEKHLSILKRDGIINVWHDRKITAGAEWGDQIDEHLETADMILLLVSSDFLSSDYCYDVEMNRALERHHQGVACVIPIILRPCDWHGAPFAKLQALPRNEKPITLWHEKDAAFEDIARGLREALRSQRKIQQDELTSPVGLWQIKVQGTIEDFDKKRLDEILRILREVSGDVNLTISSVKPGSVLIIFEGEKNGYERLAAYHMCGHLSERIGCTIESMLWKGTKNNRPKKVIRYTGEIKEIKKNYAIIQYRGGIAHFYPKDLKRTLFSDLKVGDIVEFELKKESHEKIKDIEEPKTF